MRRFILKRLLMAPAVLAILTVISFFLIRFAPGGPFDKDRAMDPVAKTELMKHYHLDRPLPVQFVLFWRDAAMGRLESTKAQGEFVHERIARHLPVSMLLGAVAMVLALSIGVTAGALAATVRDGLIDRVGMIAAMLGICLPAFVVGPLFQMLFGLWLHVLPVAGYSGGDPLFLVLPAVTLALPYAARIARLSRAGILEVLSLDHVRAARAKGLTETAVVLRHVLRGGLLPVVSFLGPAIADVLTGSLVVESIFSIPGIGAEFVTSAFNRDYNVVMGTVVVYGAILIVCNLLSDVIYALFDPRVAHRA
jgi:oligopeptide transport system permease protein